MFFLYAIQIKDSIWSNTSYVVILIHANILCSITVGVLDTEQPHAEHHYPSDRADCGGSGWRIQALPASAHSTHVACLHA